MIPFLFSFHPAIKFYKDFKAFFAANLISAACFIAWDIRFTEKGVWGFNEKFVVGVKLFNLPIEEVLFFFCIPFACVFTYKCLGRLLTPYARGRAEKFISLLLAITSFVTGIFFFTRIYTAVTFLSFSLLLVLFRFILQQQWVSSLYRAWLILLIPFFIVNGILTGTGLSSPVVWYNDQETIGIRLLTIPVEDIVYGFELIMLTVFFYEMFLTSFSAQKLKALPT
jgi:lycopene cyclase domain-containing protein